jgi:hypothetical protein
MDPDEFDERAFFQALETNGVRYLLIGRRAIAALGAPVLTSDYDLWIDIDDTEKLNALARSFDLEASATPEEARARGRYVLEGAERIDVMVARAKSTVDGVSLAFVDAYGRRIATPAYGATISLPCIDDLILTKRWAMRAKDVLDVNFLDSLKKVSP